MLHKSGCVVCFKRWELNGFRESIDLVLDMIEGAADFPDKIMVVCEEKSAIRDSSKRKGG